MRYLLKLTVVLFINIFILINGMNAVCSNMNQSYQYRNIINESADTVLNSKPFSFETIAVPKFIELMYDDFTACNISVMGSIVEFDISDIIRRMETIVDNTRLSLYILLDKTISSVNSMLSR